MINHGNFCYHLAGFEHLLFIELDRLGAGREGRGQERGRLLGEGGGQERGQLLLGEGGGRKLRGRHNPVHGLDG